MPLHCHNEYELIFITKGHGLEFIGDSVKEYIAGDLVLIGANVPHLHLCDSVTNKSIKEKAFVRFYSFLMAYSLSASRTFKNILL